MEFYVALGYRPPSASGASPDDCELSPLGLEDVSALRERFLGEPEGVLERVREALGAPVSEGAFVHALQDLEQCLREPEAALHALRQPVFRARASASLPPDFRFPLMTPEIPIDPSRTKFEPVADLRGWLLFSGKAWLHGASRQAPFRRHGDAPSASGFRYALRAPTPGHPVEVALFSHFGTGEYPARYIARQLVMRGERLDCAVHLGGVSYAGRQGEFDAHMAEPLEPLLPVTTLMTLNASAEMRSGAMPFFRYLDERRGASRAKQVQEGSYFCLASERFQLIGLDTAYFEAGRHQEPALLGWLEAVLEEGRARGATNILLSHDAPYHDGVPSPTGLLEDLHALAVRRSWVDLWCWGSAPNGALFDRAAALPFVGVSVGHAGLPALKVAPGLRSPAPLRFLETRSRFPDETALRPELGNNGYVSLLLHADGTLGLQFLDWMGNVRCTASLARDGAGPLLLETFAEGT